MVRGSTRAAGQGRGLGLSSSDQCKDDNCLSWDRLHELAQRIGFDLSVKRLGTQSDQSSCVGPISSKLKILHLINRWTSEVLMDRWMIHSHDTVVKATDLCSSAVLWGPDFEGWQSSKTLTKNIKNQFGSESYFDAVLVYFNNNQLRMPTNCLSTVKGLVLRLYWSISHTS
ncbi:hypothetical protein PPACK8108_LOCUS17209 [Phakopsora pachyrhizi]|uniref:Uncharacterized protein n=1 Tax=Phakopsora pachyrhizi TaxID=170000 RepID=A0AAV0BBL5_PHAPC|nr:hypothetical protein PPACK8108_LOCUS17209 [Phakopsora pachyrhizi]